MSMMCSTATRTGRESSRWRLQAAKPAGYDLDALAVSDRFRLFNFTRRDDYVAYLWVLRAMDLCVPRIPSAALTSRVARPALRQ